MYKIFSILLSVLFLFPLSTFAAVVNINTADATLLDTLPGIGPSKATAIVDYRTAHGPFAHSEDIQNVKGIGPSTYTGLKSSITVGDTAVVVQPSTPTSSSTIKQRATVPTPKVTTVNTSKPEHAITEVSAPTAATELAAVGAPVEVVPSTSGSALFHSSWTLGFLAVVVLAGGVLMII